MYSGDLVVDEKPDLEEFEKKYNALWDNWPVKS
jgi:hypothetical protein